jgi:hypothetical protein
MARGPMQEACAPFFSRGEVPAHAGVGADRGWGQRGGANRSGRAQDRSSAASRNDVWVRSPRPPTDYIEKNGIFANPVRGGCAQFVVQPHLQLCHAIELNLSQRP